eukprot:14514722-Ditylum_brightwellii.AAC.1
MAEEDTEALLEVLRESDDDASTLKQRFRITHQCRTQHMPAPLVDALKHAGAVWRDTVVIQNYVATPPSEQAVTMPPAMAMRGEYDCVNERCLDEWKGVFNHNMVELRTLEGCSHHGLLERGTFYGETLDNFFSKHDR